MEIAEKIYNVFKSKNIDTIIDDTEDSLSFKMKKFNLIGVPFQIIIGKNHKENQIEFKKIGDQISLLTLNQIISNITKDIKNWFQN